MNKFNIFFIRQFLKSIYQYFLKIYIFESYAKIKKFNSKGTSIFYIKSKNKILNNKPIKNYFEKDLSKLSRFNKNSKFIGIKLKNKIICSGWIFFGKSWYIDEINKKIPTKNYYTLYDFFTEKEFRNKGYYKLLLKIIRKKFKKKKLLIYSTSHNIKSIKAIKKSGFKFVKELKK
tara:strand:+ start:3994 stop:4518 length:525 start_codon:yes stop_codon:yes gene_type:complete